MDASDYLYQLQALLPPGWAWSRDPDSNLTRLLSAWADELARIDGRAGDLLNTETDPRITDEMLSDWERAYGLPDPCVGVSAETARHDALLAAITATGGSSINYFVGLAATLGIPIKIREYTPFEAGSRAGDPLGGETLWRFRCSHRCGEPLVGDWVGDWQHVWWVYPDHTPITDATAGSMTAGDPLRDWSYLIDEVHPFLAGTSRAGDPLNDWGLSRIECLFQRLKPAGTTVIFGWQ